MRVVGTRKEDSLMLHTLKDIEKCAIGATDGDIGKVKDLYFDDHAWAVRYLVVDTGSWLSGRKVLISPISIQTPDWSAHRLPVAITRDQVKNSPDIDTDKPVSRQHEVDYLGYYGYPNYWGGAGMWGGGMVPMAMVSRLRRPRREAPPTGKRAIDESAKAERARHRDDDPHLRSCEAVVGYHIHATDGEVGHVEGFLIDDETWAIRYLVVNTSNWWLGHKVLIAPQWIERRALVGPDRERRPGPRGGEERARLRPVGRRWTGNARQACTATTVVLRTGRPARRPSARSDHPAPLRARWRTRHRRPHRRASGEAVLRSD